MTVSIWVALLDSHGATAYLLILESLRCIVRRAELLRRRAAEEGLSGMSMVVSGSAS